MKKCNRCQGPNKKPGKFCSRSCANSRVWSAEDRARKSASMKQSLKVKLSVAKLHAHNRTLPPPNLGRQFVERVDWICPVCDATMRLTLSQSKRRKYCSGTCRNSVNNLVIRGVRSKAEEALSIALTELGVPFLENDRKVLGGKELDFYLPSLNLAIEWNGVYHFKNVRGADKLKKIQDSDKAKILLCKAKGIRLIVVEDLTSSKTFINHTISRLIEEIRGCRQLVVNQSPKLK